MHKLEKLVSEPIYDRFLEEEGASTDLKRGFHTKMLVLNVLIINNSFHSLYFFLPIVIRL